MIADSEHTRSDILDQYDVPAGKVRSSTQDTALMIDPYDALSLADAMHPTLTDSGLPEVLWQRGLRRDSAFTWKRTTLEVSRVLDGTAGQSETHCPALPLHDRA